MLGSSFAKAEWDESKHPRGEHGHFGSGGEKQKKSQAQLRQQYEDQHYRFGYNRAKRGNHEPLFTSTDELRMWTDDMETEGRAVAEKEKAKRERLTQLYDEGARHAREGKPDRTGGIKKGGYVLDTLDKRAEWDESKHPRGERGRFGSGGGGAQAKGDRKDKPTAAQKSRFARFIDSAKKKWKSAKPVLAQLAISVGTSLAVVAAAVAAAETHRHYSDKAHEEEVRRATEEARRKFQEDDLRSEERRRQQYRESSRARSTTVEDPAQASVRADVESASPGDAVARMKRGVKATHVMGLYLRAATPGEKEAAQAALERMGVDISRYAKAAKKNIWNALDHLITEDEANKIIEALKDMLSASQMKAVMEHPELKKVVLQVDPALVLVDTWAKLRNKRESLDFVVNDPAGDLLKSMRALARLDGQGGPKENKHYQPNRKELLRDPKALLKSWRDLAKAWDESRHPREEHGRFTEAEGGHAYGAPLRDRPWHELSHSQKLDRMGELYLLLANTAQHDSDSMRREQAGKKLDRIKELQASGNQQALLDSVGSYHDALRANRPQPKMTLEEEARRFSQQPGRGAGDNLGAAQAAYRSREESRTQTQQEFAGMHPQDIAALNRERRRLQSQREETEFRSDLESSTTGGDKSILGGLGNVLGRATRSAYHAQELALGLGSAIEHGRKGNYSELGRTLMGMRSDLKSLRNEMGHMTGEGRQLIADSIKAIQETMPKIRSALARRRKEAA